MKLKWTLVPALAAVTAGALFAASASAQDGPPPAPSAGTTLVEGLLQPKGIIMGPDGFLYVAESGTGGDTTFEGPEGPAGTTYKNGFTGRVSKIDPATGERTTVADDLPSNASTDGEALGPTDVGFVGSQLYVLITHAVPEYGFDDWTTGIYRVSGNGDVTLVADLAEFNRANPTAAIADGSQPDIEPGGNPYLMTVRGSEFFVSDGNHNRLTKVTTGGTVTSIAEFPNHPVSTGVAENNSGSFYVSYLGQGPFLPDAGKVVSVSGNGAITEIASGVAMLTDVEVRPDGSIYALQFNDPEKAGEAFFAPGTGSVVKVNADGTMTPVVTGLSFATDMLFVGDTLYVSHWGVTPMGQVQKIENFSAVVAPPPAPTAVPSTVAPPAATPTTVPSGIAGPNTGSGGYAEGATSGGSLLLLIVVTVASAGIAGTAVASRRG